MMFKDGLPTIGEKCFFVQQEQNKNKKTCSIISTPPNETPFTQSNTNFLVFLFFVL